MLRYIYLFSLIIGLISCNQAGKPDNDKNTGTRSEDEKPIITQTDKPFTISDAAIDRKAIRLALQNKDSVRLVQKAKMDSLLEDVGQRYAMQDAAGKYKKGVSLFEQQDLTAAHEQFKLALANIPENSKVNYYLGLIYYQYGQKELAYSYYSDAIRFDPLDSLSLLGVGQIYFDLKDLKNALEFYGYAIQAGPKFSSAYYNRGTLLGMQKKYIEALDDLNKAIELNPNLGTAYVNRGNTYFLLKQSNSACQDWKKAAEMGEVHGIEAYNKHCK